MRYSILGAGVLAAAASLLAVSASRHGPLPACDSAEAGQFDFWVGEWNLTWSAGQGGGQDPGKGSNVISRELDGCAIHEHFQSETSDLVGRSYSVWVAPAAQWRQTWVDNQGGYIALTGGWRDGTMDLRTAMRPGQSGGWVQYRMVFRDITPNALTWDWAVSQDSGATWQTQWRINYRRR